MHEELVKFFVATDELEVQHAVLYQTAPFGLSAAPTGLECRCFSFSFAMATTRRLTPATLIGVSGRHRASAVSTDNDGDFAVGYC
jgi:hypothetical protein